MTKFTTLSPQKEKTKTVFTHVLTSEGFKTTTYVSPAIYKNVLHLGYDPSYGDMFKAWDKDWSYTIFFGVKGNEFD